MYRYCSCVNNHARIQKVLSEGSNFDIFFSFFLFLFVYALVFVVVFVLEFFILKLRNSFLLVYLQYLEAISLDLDFIFG